MPKRCSHPSWTIVEDHLAAAAWSKQGGVLSCESEAVVTNRHRYITFTCTMCGLTWRGFPYRPSAPAYVRRAAEEVEKNRHLEVE